MLGMEVVCGFRSMSKTNGGQFSQQEQGLHRLHPPPQVLPYMTWSRELRLAFTALGSTNTRWPLTVTASCSPFLAAAVREDCACFLLPPTPLRLPPPMTGDAYWW